MGKGRKNKKSPVKRASAAVAGMSTTMCCLVLLIVIMGAYIGFNYFYTPPDDGGSGGGDGVPDIDDDDDTPPEEDDDDTPPEDDVVRYKVQLCLQWLDGISNEYKDALQFNIYTTLGTTILDYKAFTEADGDAPFAWVYGTYEAEFAEGTTLRMVMVGDDHFSFESFSTVVYTSVGPFSNSFEVYYNPIAGAIQVGDLYMTWELVV